MQNFLSKQFDRTNALVGFLVLATVFVVYNLTKAPTFSFWDCGEFIAAARMLGIPHPPGSPLFILIGRLFSELPISDDIAVRINLLSAVSNAFTALFVYLAGVRLLKLWFVKDKTTYSKFLIYAGAASGALMAAFGVTQWTNSVEAEVYGLMMVMLSACVWLTVLYFEKQGTAAGERLMALIVFIAVLGIGVHLSVFVIIPIAALLFMMKKETPVEIWFGLAGFVALELYLIFAMSSKPGEIPLFVPAMIGLLIYLFFVFSFEKIPKSHIWLGFGLLLSSLPSLNLLLSTTSNLNSILDGLGTAGLIGTSLFALYKLFEIFKSNISKKSDSSEFSISYQLAAPVIILVTAFMVLVLVSGFAGYKNFLYLSGGLVLGLGWFIRSYIRWNILIAIVSVCLVVLGFWQFVYGMLIAIPIILVLGLVFRFSNWRAALCIIVVAAAGYSVHSFLPIRSAQNPLIDQNKTSEGLQTTVNFLERKQYGSQSMVERMFIRRAEWKNQFGYYHRMGFWKFFSEQWGQFNQRFLIVLLLGLYGLWEMIRRRPKPGLTLLLLLLMCSIGLVLYMNFSDGLRQAELVGRGHIEVRDRDYFFTPFFVFFGLAIGLGGAFLIQYVREFTTKLAAPVKKTILYVMPVILLLPVVGLSANYYQCDRSNNYMPYEYAQNILMSCDPNAVLFTGGDNDTFSIWAIQSAYNYRTDVAVVCLPLANTNWYAKQMRDLYGLDLGMTDEEIDKLRPYRLPDGKVVRIQEQISSAIIAHNSNQRPINFCVTTSPSTHQYHGQAFDTLLTQVGMIFRLDPQNPNRLIDIDRSLELFAGENGFTYRSYNDFGVYKDAATLRSAKNMAQAGLMIADRLRRINDFDRIVPLARKLSKSFPTTDQAAFILATALAKTGQLDEIRQMADTAALADRNELLTIYARGLRAENRQDEAETSLLILLSQTPDFRPALEELTRLYVQANSMDGLQKLFSAWLLHNPNDSLVIEYLDRLNQSL